MDEQRINLIQCTQEEVREYTELSLELIEKERIAEKARKYLNLNKIEIMTLKTRIKHLSEKIRERTKKPE